MIKKGFTWRWTYLQSIIAQVETVEWAWMTTNWMMMQCREHNIEHGWWPPQKKTQPQKYQHLLLDF